jgi:hypothetical protein
MAHIVKWEQIVLTGHVGHMVYMVSMGHVTYANETCGTFVEDVACGTYGTFDPYLRMVHILMDLPNEYKHVFTSESKNKIRSTPNVQDFIRSHAFE